MAKRTRSATTAVLVLLVCAAAVSAAAAAGAAAGVGKGQGKGKGKAGSARAGPPPCEDLATQGDCAARAGCRWCRSEALDDMCFGATEAWRLPRQVFSCDPPSGAAQAR